MGERQSGKKKKKQLQINKIGQQLLDPYCTSLVDFPNEVQREQNWLKEVIHTKNKSL